MTDYATISVHLGEGQEGKLRKLALERMAQDARFIWADKPSIGRWLCAQADEFLFELESIDNDLIALDRVTQINWIHRTGTDIVSYGGEGTADELVAEFVNLPDTALPMWFDDHDCKLLIEWIAGSL